MKVKQQPDDFRVEELTSIQPTDRGPFAFYRLEKRGWTTPDALAAIRRRWQIDPRRLAYGGLKDRHADTIQYLSIFHGPRRGLHHQAVTLMYLGQIGSPYSSQDIRANRFQITIRNLSPGRAAQAAALADSLERDGVPNYFDDQRFGSVGDDREFVGRQMVRGQFEDALKLALASPYEFDSGEDKRIKAALRAHWGRWQECKENLPRSHARSLVDYLVHHPTDFRGALARTRPELQGMYLSAYQSDLWNRTLGEWLKERFPAEQLSFIRLRIGELPVPAGLDEQARSLMHSTLIALPAARSRFDPNVPWASAAQRVLAEDGLSWEQLKIRGMQKPFFTRGERAAFIVPVGPTASQSDDELHPGQTKLVLGFDLPRGSYATMIVKRIMLGNDASQ